MRKISIKINEECNLRCCHCFEGQGVRQKGIMPLVHFKKVASYYRERHGFTDMTILGGEPSLHPDFLAILEHATLTYDNVNVDTNGQFDCSMIDSRIEIFRRLKNLTISLQGSNAFSHEIISGRRTFEKAVDLAEYSSKKGIRINFNYTLMSHNASETHIGEIIELAARNSATIKFRKFMRIGSGEKIVHLYLRNEELHRLCKLIKKLAKANGVAVLVPPVSSINQHSCALSSKLSIYISHTGAINLCPLLTEVLPDGSRIYSEQFDFEKERVITLPSRNKESEWLHLENRSSGCNAEDFFHPEENQTQRYGKTYLNCCAVPA